MRLVAEVGTIAQPFVLDLHLDHETSYSEDIAGAFPPDQRLGCTAVHVQVVLMLKVYGTIPPLSLSLSLVYISWRNV